MNWHERWAKRAVLTIVAIAALYPLSFGPVCAMWSQYRDSADESFIAISDETFIATEPLRESQCRFTRNLKSRPIVASHF